MDGCLYLLFVLFMILGCIGYTVLLFIGIWSLPTYVIVSYFIWVTCMMGWIWIGEKENFREYILPVSVMIIVFTAILISGVPQKFYDEEPILVIFSSIGSASVFCYIASKMAIGRKNNRMEKMCEWINCLNKCYNIKLKGINELISLVQNTYMVENKIEKLLTLIDYCSGSDLKINFGKKVIEIKQDIVNQIKDNLLKYSIDIELENKTLGDVLSELEALKSEYEGKLYSEEQKDLILYDKIKNEYKLVCEKKH